jgi:hypothetical protein
LLKGSLVKVNLLGYDCGYWKTRYFIYHFLSEKPAVCGINSPPFSALSISRRCTEDGRIAGEGLQESIYLFINATYYSTANDGEMDVLFKEERMQCIFK